MKCCRTNCRLERRGFRINFRVRICTGCLSLAILEKLSYNNLLMELCCVISTTVSTWSFSLLTSKTNGSHNTTINPFAWGIRPFVFLSQVLKPSANWAYLGGLPFFIRTDGQLQLGRLLQPRRTACVRMSHGGACSKGHAMLADRICSKLLERHIE